MPTSGSILGNAVRRLEDPTLLTGEGKYVDDLVETNTLHVAFVRSPMAHATIESIDTSEASAMPGVAAVYSANDDLGLASLQQFQMMPEVEAGQLLGRVQRLAVGAGAGEAAGEDAARRGPGDEVEELGRRAPRPALDLGQHERGDQAPDAAAVDREDLHARLTGPGRLGIPLIYGVRG